MLKYNAFYTDLDIRENPRVVWYPLYFMVRRLLFGLTIVLLNQSVIWQVAGKTALVVTAVLLYGWIKPFNDPLMNKMELFNEVVIMFVVYHMICFTPFIQDYWV